jgi:hypothetical protein
VPKTQFAIDRATQAENNMSAPARNWSEKYQQLFDERSKLLEEARAAAGGAAPDPNKARTLNAIADNVFEHQKAMMTYAMGPQKAPAAIAKLEDLHQRYAMLMKVAPDGDIVKSILKGGKEGAEALMAYSNYAKDDLGAQQAMAAMLRAAKAGGTSGSTGERIAKVASKVVLGTILAKVGMPHMLVGAFASEMPNIFSKWIGQHAAGAPSTFKDFLAQEARKYTAAAASRQQVRAAAGRIAAGATLQ